MRFRVSQRARARQDILELVAYIAVENPRAAAALYDTYERILATTLAATPDIGRPYASRHSHLQGVRVIPIGRFRNHLDLLSAQRRRDRGAAGPAWGSQHPRDIERGATLG